MFVESIVRHEIDATVERRREDDEGVFQPAGKVHRTSHESGVLEKPEGPAVQIGRRHQEEEIQVQHVQALDEGVPGDEQQGTPPREDLRGTHTEVVVLQRR